MAKAKKWSDLRRRTFTPEQIAEQDKLVEQDLIEMDLQKIRKSLGKTQAELAESLEMAQGQVSDTERRSDHLVSTLRRYVEALGGELELVATFGKRRVRLQVRGS